MPDAACEVSSSEGGCAARFEEPQWAPTPGQYLVLYEGEVCVGGGVISEARADAGSRHLERAASA
jgi:tRNA-specific 2-thiouridylase